ncbi:tyrosine-type recombinase/integrase [Lentisalinibacter orientalis]|uniref:tyrosine-type recombinase/integrase n=1 Tax=Lentisalinibacter orientalis TaxID=2992241 RepID=UPI00386BEF31
MSKRNRMPGLRQKGGTWHIEKRCRYAPGGWLRESTGTTSRVEAEQVLIRRLAELEEKANRHEAAVYTFEECALHYLEEIAHKPSADTFAMHLDQLFPYIGDLPVAQVHDGTLRPFVDRQRERGLSPKSINNALGVVSTVLNRAARVWRGPDGEPWLQQAPALISRLSVKGQQARPYPLSWAEQDRLMKILPRHIADAALFAINTGCREQEVCGLRWDWEVDWPDTERSVFVLPGSATKTSTERVVVLNSIAKRVIDGRRGLHKEYVFTFRGKPFGKINNTAWKRCWRQAGLPTEKGILKGVHNLRHTFGRRLRSAGVPLETRKALLGHANGDITTHYSAAELEELIDAAESIVRRGRRETPNLMLIGRRTGEAVGKVSEKKKGLTAKVG